MGYGIIILAAGNGSRMQSNIPKVLHKVAGKAMLEHVVTVALKLSNISQVVIVAGTHIKELQSVIKQDNIMWAYQAQQLGTAHALSVGLKLLDPTVSYILVLSGDTPLISLETLNKLISNVKSGAIGIVTGTVSIPTGYGRINRDQNNNFLGIIEELDADDLQKKIKEVNAGIYLFPKQFLEEFLPEINNNNNKKEYYLVDLFKLAIDNGFHVHSETAIYPWELKSINTISQLVALERDFQIQQANKFLENGVTILDPTRFDVRGNVQISLDVEIDINVILAGDTIIEQGVKIGANCYIKDSIVKEYAIIEPNSIIDGACINKNALVGPFARIRPGTVVGSKSKVGNFVEIKSSVIGENSKINHLSYLGDAKVGNNVNIGAGTITCNYDGVNKYLTIIEDNVLIGSDCQLIAPITIAKQAVIAAGTTLIKDAPANKLTLNKKEQHSRDWQKPIKKELTKEH